MSPFVDTTKWSTSTVCFFVNVVLALSIFGWVQFSFQPAHQMSDTTIIDMVLAVPFVLLGYLGNFTIFCIGLGVYGTECRMRDTYPPWNGLINVMHLGLAVVLPYYYVLLLKAQFLGG